MARYLTSTEIESFASRPGVKRIPVENFLGTAFGPDITHEYALGNLDMDARSYRWNAATTKAIRDGVNLMFKDG